MQTIIEAGQLDIPSEAISILQKHLATKYQRLGVFRAIAEFLETKGNKGVSEGYSVWRSLDKEKQKHVLEMLSYTAQQMECFFTFRKQMSFQMYASRNQRPRCYRLKLKPNCSGIALHLLEQ